MQHMLVVKYLMVASGAWRVKLASLTDKQYLFYTFYSILPRAYVASFVFALYIGLIPLLKTGVDKVMQAISLLILCTLIGVKMYICQREKVTKMISDIEASEKNRDTWTTQTRNIYNKYAQFTQRLSVSMFSLSLVTTLTLLVTKLMVYAQQEKYIAMGIINATDVEKPMPYLAWRPVDENEHFFIAFFIDIMSALIGSTYNTITQLVFITLMTYIIGQLVILQNKFRNYGSECAVLDSYEQKFFLLRQLILEHKRMILFVEELDANMKYLMLLEFTINSFLITSVFYQLLTFKRDPVTAFLIIYGICMLVQIFVLAWHANEIGIQSFEVSQAVYDCEWYDLPKTLKEFLVIIIIRSQRPLCISVGPFFALSNSTAVTSVKAAYSYLALLLNKRNRSK